MHAQVRHSTGGVVESAVHLTGRLEHVHAINVNGLANIRNVAVLTPTFFIDSPYRHTSDDASNARESSASASL